MAEDSEDESSDTIKALSRLEDDNPVYYGNFVQVLSNIHDVVMSFGKQNPLSEGRIQVHVYIPWTSAKQLRDILAGQIASHEEIYGEIRLEPIDLEGQSDETGHND
jgi:hypothetical protein